MCLCCKDCYKQEVPSHANRSKNVKVCRVHDMKSYLEAGTLIYLFKTLTVDGVSDLLYAAATLPLWKEAPLTTPEVGRGPRASLEVLESR